MEAVVLNGNGFRMKGGGKEQRRPGSRVRMDNKGNVRRDRLPKGELKGRAAILETPT